MKPNSTLFLKIVIFFIGLVVLALCIFVLPVGIRTDRTGFYLPILYGMYVTAIPFFYAIYHILKLLGYIDTNKAFSQLSINSLRHIKYSASLISILYALGMPYIFYAADKDDAPGVVLIGLVFVFAPMVVAVFASVMQKLLQNALDLKSENDLTV